MISLVLLTYREAELERVGFFGYSLIYDKGIILTILARIYNEELREREREREREIERANIREMESIYSYDIPL